MATGSGEPASGRVEALCVSGAKGQRKTPVASAAFRAGHGIETDAHAGPWHRQVSLLARQDIDEVRQLLPAIQSGDFAENVILAGLDLATLGLGSRLALGSEVELSITQIGKICHSGCAIQQATGDCIMPRRGLFARVLRSGTVSVGDPARILERVPRELFQAVVLTISDRCSRGEATDTAGPAAATMLQDATRSHLYRIEILSDERQAIASRLKHYCDGHGIDLVLTVGGTGFAPRDVTPEATRDVVERPTPGLDEAMRAASLVHTPRAMLSRGGSGIRGSTLIVNLPGSQPAAVQNLRAILPALEHGLAKLRGDDSDCGHPPPSAPGGGAV